MSTAAVETTRSKSRYSRVFAGARANGISNEELHDLLEREYGKDSLKELTDRELNSLGNLLWEMSTGRRSAPSPKKRTDAGGRADNVRQRRKIFMLALAIGWDEASINKFCQTEYGIARHEWLPPGKCSNMIDAMNAIARREGKLI